ncbi:hypothetical protein [Sphingobium aquiterrae]|uniref:hypothetical protein n=1 Tax=Sphingobium aquiterrae TaxID=2038656 RepID=UPI00301759AF
MSRYPDAFKPGSVALPPWRNGLLRGSMGDVALAPAQNAFCVTARSISAFCHVMPTAELFMTMNICFWT